MPCDTGPHGHGEPAHDHVTACDDNQPAGTVVDVVVSGTVVSGTVVEVVEVVEVVAAGTVVDVAGVVEVVAAGTVVDVAGVVEVVGGGGTAPLNVYVNDAESFCTLSTSLAPTPDTVKDCPADNVASRRCDDAPGNPAYTNA